MNILDHALTKKVFFFLVNRKYKVYVHVDL